MGRRYKTVIVKMTIAEALSSGHSELEELKNEMEEWRDNLSGNNMEHLPKYDEVSEVVDTLENAVDNLDVDDIVSQLEEAGVNVGVEIEVSEDRPYGSKGSPRWMRCGNACALLEAAESEARSQIEQINEEREEKAEHDTDGEEKEGEAAEESEDVDPIDESILDPIEECRGECEGVDFPTMY